MSVLSLSFLLIFLIRVFKVFDGLWSLGVRFSRCYEARA